MSLNLKSAVLLLGVALLFACNKETIAIPITTPEPMDSIRIENPNILNQLASNYEQLPEQEIAISLDSSVYAQRIDTDTVF